MAGNNLVRKLYNEKSFFLLVPAAFGMLMLTACFDESSSSGTNSNQSSACALNPSETGLEIVCNNESYGFLKTSSGGVYGSCGAEALRDDSGYKLVCGGDSVGVVYNGKAGRNGVNGENGLPGQQGEKGNPGEKGNAGTSCSAMQVDTGFEIYCGDNKVGTILNGANGKNGYSCSVKAGTTTSSATVSCEDGSKATLTAIQGIQGVAGENCTTSGLRKTETSPSSDYYGYTYNEITCDGETIKVYDGKSIQGAKGDKGDDGVGCSAVKSATTGDITITCGADETSVVITKPLDGKNGDNCSIEDNGDGTATITCGTGASASTYIVKDGAAGANGDNCSIEDNENGTATITCGTATYTVKDGLNGDNCTIEDNENGTATITCGTATYTVKNGLNGDNCTIEDNENGTATITCGTATYTVNDGAAGAKGDAGYGCSAMSYTGYAVISCQSGVDDEEEPVYKKDTILAAGYVKCGTAVYEASKGVCEEGSWTAYTCGSAMLGADQFCENGVAYTKADYWTEATTYPKATYGRCDVKNPDDTTDVTIGDYYLLASQYCIGAVAKDKYQECGGVLFNATTHFCYASTVYALCGDEPYNPETHFCVSMTPYNLETYGPCGETYYNKSTQTCENGVPTPIAP